MLNPKSKIKNLKSEVGFTLVELAIVLVIIGLLLGAVLKGQEMINNAKIKRLYNQQREIAAALYLYHDKYGKFPGDDNTAATRWRGTTNGDGNGTIAWGGSFTCVDTSTSEDCQAWRHMRNAGLITGSTTSAASPSHPYGSRMGVGYTTVQRLAANWIGFIGVPYDACQSIDRQYDDGNYSTGSIRGSGDYNSATSGSFAIYFRF